MLRPGIIVGVCAAALMSGGCSTIEDAVGGVKSVVKDLAGAANTNSGSYKAPLSVPPDYRLRPPPNTKKPASTPAATTATKKKSPEELDVTPVKPTSTPAKAEPAATKVVRQPKKLTTNPVKTTKTDRAPEDRRKAVRPTPAKPVAQPSDVSGRVQPETRGKETVGTGSPSKGEDELLNRSVTKTE